MGNKKTPPETIVVDDGTNTGSEFVADQILQWDDLMLARKEACMSVIAQQQLTLTLTTEYNELIESDPELKDTILGISKSYDDIVDEIVGIDEAYKMRTGPVENTDDELEYLQIAERYIAMQEKVANISGSGYMDVFVTLKMKGVKGIDNADLASLADTMADGKQAIIDTVNEAKASASEEK